MPEHAVADDEQEVAMADLGFRQRGVLAALGERGAHLGVPGELRQDVVHEGRRLGLGGKRAEQRGEGDQAAHRAFLRLNLRRSRRGMRGSMPSNRRVCMALMRTLSCHIRKCDKPSSG